MENTQMPLENVSAFFLSKVPLLFLCSEECFYLQFLETKILLISFYKQNNFMSDMPIM